MEDLKKELEKKPTKIDEIIALITYWELSEDGSGQEMEKLAKQFSVDVSIMALRLFDIQKENLIKEIKKINTNN